MFTLFSFPIPSFLFQGDGKFTSMNTVLFENKSFTALLLSSKANSSKMRNVDVTPVLFSDFCSHGYYRNNRYAHGYYGYSIYSDGFYGNSHNAIDFYGNSHHSDGYCYSGHIKAMSVPSFLNVAPPFTAVGRTMTVRLLLPSMQCTGFPTVTFNSLPNLKNMKTI